MNNLQKYKVELQQLIQWGEHLEVAIVHECSLERVENIGVEEILERAEKMGLCDGDDQVYIPSFRKEYQQWYSDAQNVARQLLPDRLEDFCDYYQEVALRGRTPIEYENYRISDYLAGRHTMLGSPGEGYIDVRENPIVLVLFRQQLAIVKAATHSLESSLSDIKQLVQADLFDSELEAAETLIERGFHRAAGVIAGVVMEKHLAQVCKNHALKFPQRPTIKDFNKILKENNVIEDHESRFIEYLRPMRNYCSHHSAEKVVEKCAPDLVEGVKKLVKTLS